MFVEDSEDYYSLVEELMKITTLLLFVLFCLFLRYIISFFFTKSLINLNNYEMETLTYVDPKKKGNVDVLAYVTIDDPSSRRCQSLERDRNKSHP